MPSFTPIARHGRAGGDVRDESKSRMKNGPKGDELGNGSKGSALTDWWGEMGWKWCSVLTDCPGLARKLYRPGRAPEIMEHPQTITELAPVMNRPNSARRPAAGRYR